MSRPADRPARHLGQIVLIAALVTILGAWSLHRVGSRSRGTTITAGSQAGARQLSWPSQGQAALTIAEQAADALDSPAAWHPLGSSGDDRARPIASMAKVMTAYLVLQKFPVSPGGSRFSVTITPEDVVDTSLRREQDQSVAPVVAGEELTEWQALEALMLPSANNIAGILADRIGGTQKAFTDEMNRQAARFGMTKTVYTDPSGYAPTTVSTPHDQILLAQHATQLPAFRAVVAERSARIPVAGTVHNTDRLLGIHGVVGIKTGSDDDAGGCLVFESDQPGTDGRIRRVIGVVMGQRHGEYISAAARAAEPLISSAASSVEHSATP